MPKKILAFIVALLAIAVFFILLAIWGPNDLNFAERCSATAVVCVFVAALTAAVKADF